jgi:hypothetical protein
VLWNVPSRSGTTAGGLIGAAGCYPRLRRGYGRPHPRSHAGPCIQFFRYLLRYPFRAKRTVRDLIAFVIFEKVISRLDNEPITT